VTYKLTPISNSGEQTVSSQLITTAELVAQIENPKLIILDASWHLPAANRDPLAEYRQQHIPKARFFDIDGISDQDSPLPHMLPSADKFSQAVSELGISNNSDIVIYDSVGLMSAARCWWEFRVFGHEHVRVLKGGLPRWIGEDRPVTSEVTEIEKGSYKASLLAEHVASLKDVLNNCDSQESTVLDARPEARFYAEVPEPRPGLKGGHIPDSYSLPFNLLIEDGELRSPEELRNIFSERSVEEGTPVITSCGSGVTASVITLAMTEAGFGLNRLYDGSWSEWGGAEGVPTSQERD